MRKLTYSLWFLFLIASFNSYSQEQVEQQDTILTYDYRSLAVKSLFSGADTIEIQRLASENQSNPVPSTFDFESINEEDKSKLIRAIDSLNSMNESLAPPEGNQARTASASSSGAAATPGESGTAETVVALPSPSSLGKVGVGVDMVNLYTGDLNYNIPLYMLESRDLSVPISLTYSSAANKVDNISSEVGLGWSLNAGGLITRVMKGLPDEFQGPINQANGTSYTGYGWLKLKNRSVNSKSVRITNPSDFESRWPNVAHRKNIIENSALGGDVTNSYTKTEGWDTEPDEFYFNFGNHSGKFVFTQDGNVHTVPYQNFQVEKRIEEVAGVQRIIEFTVSTPEGVTYTFGNSNPNNLDATELSQMSSFSNAVIYDYEYVENWCAVAQNGYCVGEVSTYIHLPFLNITTNEIGEWILNNDNRSATYYPEFTSTWHLKKIESQNDQIVFGYEDENEINYFQGKSAVVKMPNLPRYEWTEGENRYIAAVSYEGPVSYTQNRYVHPEISYHVRNYQYMTLKSKRLKSITTSVGSEAEFNSYGLRKDLVGGTRLRNIRIKQDSKEIAGFKFEQSYFVSNPEFYIISEGGTFPYLEDDLTNALIQTFDPEFTTYDLAKLIDSEHHRLRLDRIIETSNGSNSLPPTEFSYNSLNLPRRFSADQDRWGYYNYNPRNTLINDYDHSVDQWRLFYTDVIHGGKESSGLLNWERMKITPSMSAQEVIDKLIDKYQCASNNCARKGGTRGAHGTRMQASLLTEINHSLGGATQFSYFSRKAAAEGANPTIGGAKVSTIVNLTNDGANSTTTKFNFADGRAPSKVRFKYGLLSSEYFGDLHRSVIFSSHPINSSYLTHGSAGGFGEVYVSQENKGKIKYNFITPLTIGNKKATIKTYNMGGSSVGLYPFAPEDNDWMRGKVDMISYFREGEASPFMIKDYKYELSESNLLYGLKPGFFGYRTPAYTYYLTLSQNGGFPAFVAAFYSYNSAVYRVKETIETLSGDRDVNVSTNKTTTYDYVPDHPQYVRDVTTTYENGNQDQISTKYVFDYFEEGDEIPGLAATTAEGLWDMRDHGFAAIPVEIIRKRRSDDAANWKVIGGELSTFQRGARFDSNTNSSEVYLKHKKQLVLAAPLALSSFEESSFNDNKTLFQNDSRYKVQTTFLDYNSKGRPLLSSDRSGLQTKVTWTHYNSLISSVTLNSAGNTQLKTSYVYEPLVGVTQVKDENNKALKYTYDELNRLYMVKDNEGNIAERYRYNYRNQTQSTSFYTNFRTSDGYNLACSLLRFQETDIDSYGASEYTWSFGDEGVEEDCPTSPFGGGELTGSQSTKGSTVLHRFPKAGTYTVTLTRFSPDVGKEVSRSQNIIIHNQKASVKIFAPGEVEDCGNGNPYYDQGYTEATEQIIEPIDDGDGNGDGHPTIYVRIGYDNDGATCNEGGYSSASLKYKDYYGNWQTFSNTSSGVIPDDVFHYRAAPFDIELEGTFSDNCSSTSHTVNAIVRVVRCTSNSGTGGTGGTGGPIDPDGPSDEFLDPGDGGGVE